MTAGIRWTPEQLAAHNASQNFDAIRADAAAKRYQSIGRLPKGTMNRTETAYAALLDEKKRTGEVLEWRFHPFNVRLAANTFYEVDFIVLTGDMRLEIHEVKGDYTNPVGQMKIKLCAEALPFFRMLKCIRQSKKNGGGWKIEEFYECCPVEKS